MAKYTFIREDNDGEINTASFESEVWYIVIDRFINFLRGSGYFIGNNSAGINIAAGHTFDPYNYCTTNLVAFEKE